jgi:myo-inositol 2-dehydrogenase / D-chiro-inositol 1-dehydrogenase
MIRLGLIGCGEHSQNAHAVPLARYKAAHPDEIELAGACDLRLGRAQRFCEQYGFLAPCRSVEELLSREKLDGCIAVVPPEKISALGIELLSMGMPCVVEKPLGTSLDEIRALCDSAAASGTPNMVSVNRRFMPYLNHALDWARNAGPLRYVHCRLARHARSERNFIWETAVHAVDALRYIAGDVRAWNVRSLPTKSEAVPWYSIEFEFVNAVAGRVDVLPTCGMVEETYDLFGDGFRASVTAPFGQRRGWRGLREGRIVAEEMESTDVPEDIVPGFYDETSAFIRSLSRGQGLKPSIAEVSPSVEICLAIAKMRSADRNI